MMPSEYLRAKLAWPPVTDCLSTFVKTDFPIHLKSLDLMQETPNMKFSNALFYSVLKGRLQKTKFLLDQDIRVNARNDHGYNPLVAALHIDKDSKRRKMFRLLLQNGANPLSRDVTNDRDVLSWACLLGCSEQVVTLLTDFGGDVHLNDIDNQGLSALHYATHSDNLAIVSSLITIFSKYKISVDVLDSRGMTPYAHARRLGHSTIAELLKTEGNASIGHADSINFKSPREWSQIGRFERQWDEYHATKEQLNKARIYGKINKANALRDLKMPTAPSLTLTYLQDGCSSRFRSDFVTDGGLNTGNDGRGHRRDGMDWPSSHLNKTKESDRLVQSVCTFPTARVKSKLSHSDKWSPLPFDSTFDDIDSQSVATRLSNKAALNLLAMTSHKGKMVARFHSSEFDKTKSSQYQSDVRSFLTILSDQSSSSYRQSVAVPPPHVPTPPLSKHRGKNKSKISSLAIIMGKQKSGSKRKKNGSLSKINDLLKSKKGNTGRNSKSKNKSKNFLLPDIKINDRAI